MPRPANPNSKYSQRKARREFQERYANMTPEEKAKIDNPTTLIMVGILVAVFFFAFLFGGENGLSCAAKWATR
ncbi:hypothetical protein [Algoriphagus boritolerans]|uniref:Uncharacterized protein n=1 Tax=Algoriphagus boritolerans DSM 17298 = JCM 18970 TaxID=1120964 RepID=A0A1H5ZH31_9BACT|nr:hypothetical protein [Algoriphagus boritolerans]SEG35833.1 hypothetical protein SAMN03080598_03525 [Algoriphagus boritolerans DSM 17298 = JCM 18970]